jgi:phage shock protein C
MSAFCSNCGSGLPPAARFCSVCGSTVNGFPPAGFPPYAPRLVRPLYGRQCAGVCIGLARTYGWDVSLVRILAIITGIFLCPIPEIAYIACWIGIPEEPVGVAPPPPQV